MVGNPERVAFYLPSFERGGVERFVVNVTQPMLDEGVAVDLLTVRQSALAAQLPDGVRQVDIGTRCLFRAAKRLFPVHVAAGIGSLPGYVRYLRRERPEMVVSLQVHPFAVFGAAAFGPAATVVVRESNTPSVATRSPDHLTGRLAPLAKRVTYTLADHVTANSEDARDDVVSWLGLSKSQVTAIYNPTYTQRIRTLADEPVGHPWFDDDVPVVVSVGRFSDQKDFATLLRAFARVRKRTPARLLLVGDGDNRAGLERLTATLGVDDSVDFVGYQDNPYKYVASADLFVLSSHYEGLPNVLIEALGVGTPAVATDCPSGPREILLDGDGGHLVPVGDAEAMADAVVTALTTPSDTRARLATAREALDRFTPQRAARAYLSLVE